MIERAQMARYVQTLFGGAKEREGGVFFTSLENNSAGHGERKVVTRDLAVVEAHADRWDKPGRAFYACVNLLKPGEPSRSKTAIGTLVTIHADMDFKSIDASPEEGLIRIAELSLLPTMVVLSGNGAHLYWVLSDPLDATDGNIELVETLNARAGDVVGGDPVRDVSRLLRLPGTHNTKDGAFKLVELSSIGSGKFYDVDELDEWLSVQGPVIGRKEKGFAKSDTPESNPFLEAAKRYGYKPSIDVEQRLAAMSFGAAGDASIHQTQLQVTASLLSRGQPVEEVVDLVLAATRGAAGQFGDRWNWRREESAIRRMCQTWVSKNPPESRPAPRKVVEERSGGERIASGERAASKVAASGGGAVVHDISEARQKRAPKARTDDKIDMVAAIAEGVIEEVRSNGSDLLLTEGQMHVYEDGVWRIATSADEQWLRSRIQACCETLGSKLQNGVLAGAWKRLNEHPSLLKRKIEWDAPTHILCLNGALNVVTQEFEALRPELYMRRRTDVLFDAGARAPRFLKLLDRIFADRDGPDREGVIALVQENYGAALAVKTLSREERKALILVGPSRTGKTELARVLSRIVGSPIASPSVADISAKAFGLQSFVGASAWIRDDATNEGDKLDPQRFKTIVTGEAIDIERKNRDPVRIELAIPVLLTCNSLPRSRDASDAIYNRSHVIEMTNVVSEAEAHAYRRSIGCAAGASLGSFIFEREAAGILNWALEGLLRLRERGGYAPPSSVQAAIQRFRDDNNPVHAWAAVALERDPKGRIARNDLRCSFNGWQREEEGDEARAWGARAFFPKLRAACPWADCDHQDHSGARWGIGFSMTKAGLGWWQSHKDAPLKNGTSGQSQTKEDVNRRHDASDAGAAQDARTVSPSQAKIERGDDAPRF